MPDSEEREDQLDAVEEPEATKEPGTSDDLNAAEESDGADEGDSETPEVLNTSENADEKSDAAPAHVTVPDISDAGDASPLREMVEYVARALTSNPDAVQVSEEDDGNRTVFHLSVDEKDKGKVIGRDGRVAQSIRSLLRVAATKQGTRITLEID